VYISLSSKYIPKRIHPFRCRRPNDRYVHRRDRGPPRTDDRPTDLVSAGSRGEEATEDHVGAVLIASYLAGEPPADVERQVHRDVLEVAQGHDYVDRHEIRRRDVQSDAMALDSRSVVPHPVGDRLVDVSEDASLDRAVADPASD
jgi:2-phosphosulfolactate phosphatase